MKRSIIFRFSLTASALSVASVAGAAIVRTKLSPAKWLTQTQMKAKITGTGSDRRCRPEHRRLITAATAVESVRHRESLPLAMITDYKWAAERTDIDNAPVTGRR